MSESQSSAAMLSRRGLLKGSALLGGLVIGTYLPASVTRSFAADLVKARAWATTPNKAMARLCALTTAAPLR